MANKAKGLTDAEVQVRIARGEVQSGYDTNSRTALEIVRPTS